MKTKQFPVKFSDKSTHWVNVILHPSRTSMRRALRKVGHNSSDTDACCWQSNRPGRDNLVAEIHYARDFLDAETIIHEAIHAAWICAVHCGFPHGTIGFEERICYDASRVSEIIMAWFDKHRVPVRYGTLPKRRLL